MSVIPTVLDNDLFHGRRRTTPAIPPAADIRRQISEVDGTTVFVPGAVPGVVKVARSPGAGLRIGVPKLLSHKAYSIAGNQVASGGKAAISKALLEFTRRAAGAADFDDAFTWLRKVRAEISEHDSVERYTQNGVDVFLGSAHLLDDTTVQVGDQRLNARRIVLATGARAAIPPIPGLAECEPLTNETLFDLREAPASLAILGAGAVGCEMAQAFVRLGVEVQLFEMADRVLPLEEPEASAVIAQALQRNGVTLHLNAPVSKISRHDSKVTVHSPDVQVTVDRILVAAGRRANIEDLNLDVVGVDTVAGLVKVDRRLRTSNPRIYAAGDVCSRAQFTHNADAQEDIHGKGHHHQDLSPVIQAVVVLED